jgi:hypothetical protein
MSWIAYLKQIYNNTTKLKMVVKIFLKIPQKIFWDLWNMQIFNELGIPFKKKKLNGLMGLIVFLTNIFVRNL